MKEPTRSFSDRVALNPVYALMMAELRGLSARHQAGGKVEFLYRTVVYCGRIA